MEGGRESDAGGVMQGVMEGGDSGGGGREGGSGGAGPLVFVPGRSFAFVGAHFRS